MDADQQIREAVGLIDPASAIFIKQYGERRTGSNALRALLSQNFKNLFVLMHILGDKHSAPVDLPERYRAAAHSADAAWQFAWSATYDVPSETTRVGNFMQARFLRAMYRPLFQAFAEQRFFRVLSVRDPYHWAAALLGYQGWPAVLEAGTWEHAAAADRLDGACEEFNQKHRAWLAAHAVHQPRSFIVQAERLRQGWEGVLIELEQGMGLTRRCDHEPFAAVTRPVRPAPWDFVRSMASEEWLDSIQPHAPVRLAEALHHLVTRQIDWALMAPLGYFPRPFEETGTGRAARHSPVVAV